MSRTQIVDDLRYDMASGRFRREDGLVLDLVHDIERDLWLGPEGAVYVQNLSRLDDPVLIRIDGSIWHTRHLGRIHSIDWNHISLSGKPKGEFRLVLQERLRHVTPGEISLARTMLATLSKAAGQLDINIDQSVGTWTVADLTRLILASETATANIGSYLRCYYRAMVEMELPGCTSERLELIEQVRIKQGKKGLATVLAWDPNAGALTTQELEHLRRNLLPPRDTETAMEHFARVFLRTLVALGRRPVQMLGVKDTGVSRPKNDDRLPAVIWIPGAKAQRNDRPRPYDLPEGIYVDLMAFAARPEIREAQQRFGYFFVTPPVSQTRIAGPRDPGNTLIVLQDWIARHGIISPRTGEPLHVTPTRLRHTVATQLARKGWCKEDIQEFLEHRGDSAVLAYLDAVGNDMTPALERADRALGGLFSALSDNFHGRVVRRPEGRIAKPILVPSPENRAIIGQCGLAGTCPKAPFSACLSGCAHFLFFKDADVDAARAHIRAEHERWRKAEPSAERARTHDDFARMEAGLLEAQRRAENLNE